MEQPQPTPDRARQQLRLIRASIWIIVLAVFGRLCTAEFSWYDDGETVHQNPALNPPSAAKVAGYWTAIGRRAPQQIYIPLTYTVWGIVAEFSYLHQPDDYGVRLNPWAFHSVNVVLHAMAALVAFELLRLLIQNGLAAAAGALLFALHPVQVEPVAWVSGLKDVLCGLFSLIALWQYVSHAMRGGRSHYALATLALAAALFSKPTAIVTPIFALIIDWLLIKRPWRQFAGDLWLWFLLAAPIAVIAGISQPAIGAEPAPLWARPLIAMDSLAFYLGKIVAPLRHAVDYGRKPMVVYENGWFRFTWIAPALVAGTLLLPRVRRRHPALLAAGAMLVAGVIPVLGLVPFSFQTISGVADHYLYLSMLGPALAAAYLLSQYPSRAMNGVAVAVLVVLATLSFRQAGYWHDDVVLFQQTLDLNPTSFMALNNHGAAMIRRNDLDVAERDFRRAIELNPKDSLSHENLALVLMSRDQHAEASEELRIAIELDPHNESAREKQKVLEKMQAKPN